MGCCGCSFFLCDIAAHFILKQYFSLPKGNQPCAVFPSVGFLQGGFAQGLFSSPLFTCLFPHLQIRFRGTLFFFVFFFLCKTFFPNVLQSPSCVHPKERFFFDRVSPNISKELSAFWRSPHRHFRDLHYQMISNGISKFPYPQHSLKYFPSIFLDNHQKAHTLWVGGWCSETYLTNANVGSYIRIFRSRVSYL